MKTWLGKLRCKWRGGHKWWFSDCYKPVEEVLFPASDIRLGVCVGLAGGVALVALLVLLRAVPVELDRDGLALVRRRERSALGMKIEVTLPDARFCTKECPAFHEDSEYDEECDLDYWAYHSCVLAWVRGNEVVPMGGGGRYEAPDNRNGWRLLIVRPQKCIEEHGE